MAETKITRDQLKRLQTLWGQYVRHEMVPNTREERLRWANEVLSGLRQAQWKHGQPIVPLAKLMVRSFPISSFSDLTLQEASLLINAIQFALRIEETSPSARPRRYRSRIKDRDRAHAAGTEGRRGNRAKFTIATAEDLAMIDAQLGEMGWTRARLDALLQSPSSPLGERRRSNPQMRTLGDVNRVLWALKRIAARCPKPEAQQ